MIRFIKYYPVLTCFSYLALDVLHWLICTISDRPTFFLLPYCLD